MFVNVWLTPEKKQFPKVFNKFGNETKKPKILFADLTDSKKQDILIRLSFNL